MLYKKLVIESAMLAVVCSVDIAGVSAAPNRGYDATPAWPLCGRIAEEPPPGWTGTPATWNCAL